MHELLSSVFQDLELENVKYCLLRDCDQIDQLMEIGEVDLLVQSDQLELLEKLLGRLGFVSLPNLGHWPHNFFLTYDDETDAWLKIDVVTEVAFGSPTHAYKTDLAAACLNDRKRCGPAFFPPPEAELVTLLLHCVLDKGRFESHRRQRVQMLRKQIEAEHLMNALLAAHWSPEMTWSRLASLIDSEDWSSLLSERASIIQRFVEQDRLQIRWRFIRDKVFRKINRWTGLFRQRIPMVAILAPDGAGKSTLASGVRDASYFPVRSIYMGLYQNGKKEKKRAIFPGVGLVTRLFTQWQRYLSARFFQARGELVIFDRYAYDSLLPSHRSLRWPSKARRWILGNACPPPDLVIMLDAPGEALFARKGEHSPIILEDQRQGYLKLQSRLPQMVVVDATQDAECVLHEVNRIIWRNYSGLESQGAGR